MIVHLTKIVRALLPKRDWFIIHVYSEHLILNFFDTYKYCSLLVIVQRANIQYYGRFISIH